MPRMRKGPEVDGTHPATMVISVIKTVPEPPYRRWQSVWLFVRPYHEGTVRHLDYIT